MKALKFLLFPFSFIYGVVVYFRNLLFDAKIFQSTGFDIPVISVGNLTTGGTGKTPHIEYLAKLLKDEYNIAILSRGYGRNTKGYIAATADSPAIEIGDEPRQYIQKFQDITVAVCEKRVVGVQKIIQSHPSTNAVLLDDAFQHRAIKPGLSILLVKYGHLFRKNYLLPLGTLRERLSGSARADVIIVTKTPKTISAFERKRAKELYKLQPNQTIYFSYIKYAAPLPLWDLPQPVPNIKYCLENEYHILALTGIANPKSLLDYLRNHSKNVIPASFPDHHDFTPKDLLHVKQLFNGIKETKKIIITTEKDAMRLMKSGVSVLKGLPIYYIPIETAFHDNDGPEFNDQITSYIKTSLQKNGL